MVSIRKTTKDEADLLAEIQRQAFLPLYEHYHDAGNPALRGPEDILKRLNSPFFHCFTILYEGETVGGIIYKCQGGTPFQEELSPGEYYLQRVFIRPEYQGKHIARTAIRLCEKEFPDATAYFVDFPDDLEKNRRSYESAGFRDTGKRLEFAPGLVLAAMEKQG